MDIDDKLRQARESAAGWNAARAVEVARVVAAAHRLKLDWDDGAGEGWISLVDDGQVVAYISTAIPLAIAMTSYLPFDKAGAELTLIPVEWLHEPVLSGGPAALEEAFGESDRFALLDRDAFSADDLWYVTV